MLSFKYSLLCSYHAPYVLYHFFTLDLSSRSSVHNSSISTDKVPTLAPLGSRARQEQLVTLLAGKIQIVEDDKALTAKLRKGAEKFVRILMFTKDFVSQVASNEPHAALAWAGVGIVLPVRFPSVKSFPMLTGSFS